MSDLVWLHLEAWGGGPTLECSLPLLFPSASPLYPLPGLPARRSWFEVKFKVAWSLSRIRIFSSCRPDPSWTCACPVSLHASHCYCSYLSILLSASLLCSVSPSFPPPLNNCVIWSKPLTLPNHGLFTEKVIDSLVSVNAIPP